MPKQKTHKATSKRVKVTSTGKVMRRGAGDKHFNQKKSASRKRATAVNKVVVGKLAKNLKRAVGA